MMCYNAFYGNVERIFCVQIWTIWDWMLAKWKMANVKLWDLTNHLKCETVKNTMDNMNLSVIGGLLQCPLMF